MAYNLRKDAKKILFIYSLLVIAFFLNVNLMIGQNSFFNLKNKCIWVSSCYSGYNYPAHDKLDNYRPKWEFITDTTYQVTNSSCLNDSNNHIKNLPTYFIFYPNGELYIYNEEFELISNFAFWKIDNDDILLNVPYYIAKNCQLDISIKGKLKFNNNGIYEIIFFPSSTYESTHNFKVDLVFQYE